MRAVGNRLRAGNEKLCAPLGAYRRGAQPCRRINLDFHDPRWPREVIAAKLRPDRQRFFDEVSPQRQRYLGGFHVYVGVVVETDPDGANEIWNVAYKPAVV